MRGMRFPRVRFVVSSSSRARVLVKTGFEKYLEQRLTGDNEVSFLQRHDAADVSNEVGDVEQHVARTALLPQLAIHLQQQKNLVKSRNF